MRALPRPSQDHWRARGTPPVNRRQLRTGAATLEYVLVMGAALPMIAMSYYYSTRIIRAVYQMTCALVCWPFM